jgi:hypothetical protein
VMEQSKAMSANCLGASIRINPPRQHLITPGLDRHPTACGTISEAKI